MTKKERKQRSYEEKMDMTPLIDCVFLLIMFFILTTEITVKAAQVLLPFALEGKVEKGAAPEDLTRVLDIVWDEEKVRAGGEGAGRIEHNGRALDPRALVDLLQKEVDYDYRDPPYGRGRTPESGPNNSRLSQLKIKIRPDKRVNARYLRDIFTACATVDPKIYKLEISSEQPQKQ